MKIEYIRGKDGKAINIRKKTDKLKHFTVTQGSCSDGKYIYMIFERKKKKNRTHRCKIVKFDPEAKRVKKVSGELKIGHGNDITYRKGILYITHSAGEKVVHRVDAKTLEQKKGIKVIIPKKYKKKSIEAFNGIACYGDGFILRVMGGSGMLITDGNLKGTRYFKTEKNYTTSQGMDQKGDMTYRAYSKGQSDDKNYLCTFDGKGNLIKRRRVEVRGEMECVFFIKEQLYGTVYRKKKDDAGKMKYKAYVYKIG